MYNNQFNNQFFNPQYVNPNYYYVEHLDNILKTMGEKLLTGAGTVSHTQALEKAKQEYQKYIVANLSPVEEAYLQTIKDVEKKAKKKGK